MFLSRVSEKSQFVLLPLGLGSAFGVLSTQAIAHPPAKSLSKDLSCSTLFIKGSPTSATKDAIDTSVETVVGLSFLQSSTALSPFIRVGSRYQPTFSAAPPQQKQAEPEKTKPESLFKQMPRLASVPTITCKEADPSEESDERALPSSASNASAPALAQLIDAIDLGHVAPKQLENEPAHEPSPAGPSVTPTFSGVLSNAPKPLAFSNTAPENTSFGHPPTLESLLPYESPTQTLTEQPAPKQLADEQTAQQAVSEPADSELGQALPVISPERLPALPERTDFPMAEDEDDSNSDDELGTLRLRLERSLSAEDEDLGILRTIQTAQAPPEPPKPPIAFLSGRLGFFDTNNAFRISQVEGGEQTIDSQIYQSGLSLLFFPRLSETTNLYAIAETNIARYSDEDVILFNSDGLERGTIRPNYNEVELQLGLRQKLFRRTYAQLGWRHQVLFGEGYRKRRFTANYIDARLSHRAVLNRKTWLDSIYQARVGFTSSERADRFRQTFTLSLNHAFTKDLRTSLLYQLDLADFTRTPRFDTYQQLFGTVSYNLTPESRISLFAGTRFGNSTRSDIILDDTFYGASLNVTVPLF